MADPIKSVISPKASVSLAVAKSANQKVNKSNSNQSDSPLAHRSFSEGGTHRLPTEALRSGSSGSKTSTQVGPTDSPNWYVIHAYSGHESKVAATLKQRIESQKLQDKILSILVPTQEKIEIKEGKKNKIREKLFPGYILIKMILDDNTWLAVRTTPGVTSFVGNANRPTPLPEEEVASIQRFTEMEAPKFKTTFSLGEAVKIVDGPFSEFLGSISEMDETRGKLKVMVSIFGRETPVELDFLQVAKL